MDTSTIYAIANELGIAIDSAQQFIEYILPQMASYEVTTCIISLVISSIFVLIPLPVIIIGFKHEWNEDGLFGLILVEVFIFIVWIVLLFILLPKLIGWLNWPEVMLLNKVIG